MRTIGLVQAWALFDLYLPTVMVLILLAAFLAGIAATSWFALARRRAEKEERVIRQERKVKSAAS